jgi:hypothetical protein
MNRIHVTRLTAQVKSTAAVRQQNGTSKNGSWTTRRESQNKQRVRCGSVVYSLDQWLPWCEEKNLTLPQTQIYKNYLKCHLAIKKMIMAYL